MTTETMEVEDNGDDQHRLTLIAKGLSGNVTEDYLKKIFGHYGEVTSTKVVQSHNRHRVRSQTGYIKFKRQSDAEEAFMDMDGVGQIDGAIAHLKFESPPLQKQSKAVPSIRRRRQSLSPRKRARVESNGQSDAVYSSRHNYASRHYNRQSDDVYTSRHNYASSHYSSTSSSPSSRHESSQRVGHSSSRRYSSSSHESSQRVGHSSSRRHSSSSHESSQRVGHSSSRRHSSSSNYHFSSASPSSSQRGGSTRHRSIHSSPRKLSFESTAGRRYSSSRHSPTP